MTALLEYLDLTALLEYIDLLNRYSGGPGQNAPVAPPLWAALEVPPRVHNIVVGSW